jgi:hypothetical protein
MKGKVAASRMRAVCTCISNREQFKQQCIAILRSNEVFLVQLWYVAVIYIKIFSLYRELLCVFKNKVFSWPLFSSPSFSTDKHTSN